MAFFGRRFNLGLLLTLRRRYCCIDAMRCDLLLHVYFIRSLSRPPDLEFNSPEARVVLFPRYLGSLGLDPLSWLILRIYPFEVPLSPKSGFCLSDVFYSLKQCINFIQFDLWAYFGHTSECFLFFRIIQNYHTKIQTFLNICYNDLGQI